MMTAPCEGSGRCAPPAATQDIGLTRWRGRWDSMRSLEHYVQELASHEAFARLDPISRAKVFRLADLLPAVLQMA